MTIAEFTSQISEKLLEQDTYGDIAIMAGNYVLGPNADYTKNYGIYPDSSLEIASNIIREVRSQTRNRVFIFTVINDWKFLVKNPHAEEIRKDYWSNPKFDLRQKLDPDLLGHLLPGNMISSQRSDTDINLGRYSEQKLHNKYSKFIKVGNRKAEVDQLYDEIGLTADVCEGQVCSLNKCASEIVMILQNLYQLKIRRFIGLLPAECSNNLEIGTRLFNTGHGIFLPEFQQPMLIDHHFLNCTGPQTEEELFEANIAQKTSRYLIK